VATPEPSREHCQTHLIAYVCSING